MTHRASWMERSASSITSLLEPRTTMLTVLPGLVQPVICAGGEQAVRSCPVTFDRRRPCNAYLHQLSRTFQVDLLCQLSRAQHLWGEVVNVGDRFGANRLQKTCCLYLQDEQGNTDPTLLQIICHKTVFTSVALFGCLTLQINSMSSLSMSFTTMIFILLRKCRARSLRASLQRRNTFSADARASVRGVCAHLRTGGWTSG